MDTQEAAIKLEICNLGISHSVHYISCGCGMGPSLQTLRPELFGVVMCGKCLHEMAEARREEEEKQEA